MATWRSFYPVSTILFLLLCHSGLCVEGKVEDGETDDKGAILSQEGISQKYMVVWDSVDVNLMSSRDDFKQDIESVVCTSDVNCTAALANLDVALAFDSTLPSRPYCKLPVDRDVNSTSGVSHCTCGPGKCESYSRDSQDSSSRFYYCGPCGWVGAQCVNHSCTHPLAECRGGYCECVNDGIFYDLTYCYIPFYGKKLAMEMLISTAVIVLLCSLLAYGYHRLNVRRQQGFPDSWFRGSVRRESPANDTPPTYDDVVEKLPSYQDALNMVKEKEVEGGVNNEAFEGDAQPPPSYDDSQNISSIVTAASLPAPRATSTPKATPPTTSTDSSSTPKATSPATSTDSFSTPKATSPATSTDSSSTPKATPPATSTDSCRSTSESERGTVDEPDGASIPPDICGKAVECQPAEKK